MTEVTTTPKQADHVFYRDLNKSFPRAHRAEGCYIWDDTGKRYLDAAGGICNTTIGHHVEEVRQAYDRQFDEICFAYHHYFTNRPQDELAERMVRLAPPGFDNGKVFFTSGGSEATETALKMAREYHIKRGKPSKVKVVGRWQSYHGNTIGALSMSGHRARRRNYNPYLLPFPHISPCYCARCWHGLSYPGCDLACARELDHVISFEGPENIAAFISEPVPVGFGMTIAPPQYWPLIREVCDRHDVLLIVDEVLTGCGRTGVPFAISNWGVSPDLIAFGKGVSSGYAPLGGVIANDHVVDGFLSADGLFDHSFTHVGNPICCAIGEAVMGYVETHDLIARAARMESYMRASLSQLLELPMVAAINGKGLLWGIEFVADKATMALFPRKLRVAERLEEACMAKGVLTIANASQGDGERGDYFILTPPFTITEEQIDEMTAVIAEALAEVAREVM